MVYKTLKDRLEYIIHEDELDFVLKLVRDIKMVNELYLDDSLEDVLINEINSRIRSLNNNQRIYMGIILNELDEDF
jgi:hypothetical protein